MVIAIIGILSSVVLASLGKARQKGQTVSVRAQLSSSRSQAELYYLSNSSVYHSGTVDTTSTAGNCTDANSLFAGTINGMANLINGLGKYATVSCFADAKTWSITSDVTGVTDIFCVDSTGKISSNAIGTTTAAGMLNSSNMCY